MEPETIYLFDQFELMSRRQILVRAGSPIPVGSRAVAVLTALVERAGELVSKEDLLAAAWPNVFVHEANLKVAVSTLRRVLGETAAYPSYIATVPGRGYRFIARLMSEATPTTSLVRGPDAQSLPPERPIVGREAEVHRAVESVTQHRLVTVIGPGGVGKTTVAIAAAHRLRDAFPDPPCFVDLSLVGEDAGVPAFVASAVGVRGSPTNLSGAVAELVAQRRMLVILDNCEHVLRGIGVLAERLLKSVSASRLLLTSREPVGHRDESLVHIQSLPVPDAESDLRANDVLGYAAVELFVTRAREWTDYEFDASQADVISRICRSLEGLPLALEIGAAQLDRYRPGELLARLDEHLAAFRNRSDCVHSRQKTLWATVDWSYQLLSADEALVFRFVSVFAGTFDVDDVLAVLGTVGLDAYRVTVSLGALVAKSLVVASVDGDSVSYRLLDSARRYASERAREDPRLPSIRDSHARHMLAVFRRSEEEWVWCETIQWRRHYKARLSDLRQALDWCFGAGGRPDLGFELTVSALPLWDELSSVSEAQPRIEQALSYALKDGRNFKSLAKLTRARAWHLLYAECIVPESEEAWATALEYARRTGEVELELRALWGFGAYLCHTGKLVRALRAFEQFQDLATQHGVWTALPDGEWHHALTEIYLSRLDSARSRLEKLARDNPPIAPRTCAARFVVDRAIAIETHLCLVLWLAGEPERALRLADDVSDLPDDIHNPVSQLGHLAWSRLPIAMWNRDVPQLLTFTSRLRRHLQVEHIPVWLPILDFYQALADHHGGDPDAIHRMDGALDALTSSNLVARMPLYLGELARALLEHGERDRAEATVQRALLFAARNGERWTDPELLRVSAAISRAKGDGRIAEQALGTAIGTALETGAVFFALRAAIDLAEMQLARGNAAAARDVLGPVYGRFSGGFDTCDLAKASALLARTSPG